MIIKGFFIIIQLILDSLALILKFVLKAFPKSPFNVLNSGKYASLLSEVNYFIPVFDFVAIFQAYLAIVAVYYAYSVVARWINAIE